MVSQAASLKLIRATCSDYWQSSFGDVKLRWCCSVVAFCSLLTNLTIKCRWHRVCPHSYHTRAQVTTPLLHTVLMKHCNCTETKGLQFFQPCCTHGNRLLPSIFSLKVWNRNVYNRNYKLYRDVIQECKFSSPHLLLRNSEFFHIHVLLTHFMNFNRIFP